MASDNLREMFWKEQDKAEGLGTELPATVLAPPQGFCPAVGCMDEGVTTISGQPIAVRLAGSGALMCHSLPASQDAVAAIVDKYNLSCMSWHLDCGAGLVLAERLDRPAKGDKLIEDFAVCVAEVVMASVVRTSLQRPPQQHIAVCHYYAGTQVAPHLGGLPAGFVTSRFVLGESTYGKDELAMAAGIAFGDHGFGELFTPESPYTIVAVATNRGQLDQYLAEIREVIAGLSDNIRPRVAVRAFICRNPVKL